MPLEFSDALSAKVLRVDQNVLSVRYSESIYQGGAHGSYWSFAYNFDMRSGEILSLESLSPDYDALADSLVQEMLALAEEDQDEYYSQRIVEGFLPEGGREEAFRTLLREGTWALDREGLEIISSLYELGPYAAGTVSFLIPYEKLQERLDQRWMMPEDRNGKGRVLVQELSELEGGEIEIIDKVKVSEGGVNLGLVVEGQIFDVRISTVYYVDRFYENAQLWAASSLADCAVQLEVTVPEGLPDLLISYYTADGERCGKLLSQSGADGSYMLVDDNIEAVG